MAQKILAFKTKDGQICSTELEALQHEAYTELCELLGSGEDTDLWRLVKFPGRIVQILKPLLT